ncbi:MAG: hydroxyacylglutathione hydrolase [Jannaschia sp.]
MTSIVDTLVTVPALKDNYDFLFRAGNRVACVDVADPAPVLAALADRGWTLTDILLTHHHWDHADGVPDLVAATGAKVWGNAADAERLPPLDHPVRAGDTIEIGGARATVWDVSGHTIGHVAFVFDGIVFTGDSLMAAGCGRLFEGSPERMFASLSQFANLPDATLIASGHEYTLSNLSFAASLEPDSTAIKSRIVDTERLLAEGEPSVPSTLGTERHTNPFLRSHIDAVKAATGTIGQEDVLTFAASRRAKDAF